MSESSDRVMALEYQRVDAERRVRLSKIGCILGLVLFPAGSSLDYMVYGHDSELFLLLLKIRILIDVVLALFLALHFTSIGVRHIRAVGIAWVCCVIATLASMVAVSEGASSPYYAGLNLLILAVAVLLPWTFVETSLICAVTLAGYLAACAWHDGSGFVLSDVRSLFNNVYFLFSTAVICCTASYFNSRARFEDFRLRYQLDERNRQLAEMDRLKSEFFANVSHELRTPLTLILAPVDRLLHGQSSLPDELRTALNIVRKNALRLMRLINNLLSIVRLESGALNLDKKPLDLTIWVPGIAESVRHLANAKGLSLTTDGDLDSALIVEADAGSLEKVLLNLLTNAIKFTHKGGSITLRWGRSESEVYVDVEDTGIGIPESELSRIFDRFQQVDGSATRKYQGLGIGLALAKQLVEEHHGRLTVSSTLGQGTIFRMILAPAAESATARSEERGPEPDPIVDAMREAELEDPGLGIRQEVYPTPSPPDQRARLLVVDDEPDMLEFLTSLLSDEFQVERQIDAQGALDSIEKSPPDLMVLDWMLPGLSGPEICRRLRQGEHTKDIKILLLTARADEASKLEALESGVDDFLTKPFSSIEVRTRLKNLLQTSALQRDLRARNVDLEEAMARLKATEAQLVQSEKMNALGSLSAGLLHEINNPLNFTLTAVQVAQELSDSNSDPIDEMLRDIKDGMVRISDIVTSLRTFAYPDRGERVDVFELKEAVDTALRFTAHQCDGVNIRRDFAESAPVRCSKTHVVQVFVNLISNSLKAVENVRNDREPTITIGSKPNGRRLVVQVHDNGVGVEQERLSRVFDPFYTTSEVGKGMGLGLSICHTIITNQGGTMKAESRVNEGTTMTFDLPLATDDSSHAA